MRSPDGSRRSPGHTMLGVFGPLGLLRILGVLSAGVLLCYAGVYLTATPAHACTSAVIP